MTAPTRMKTLIFPGARTCTLSTSHPSTMPPTYTPVRLAAVRPLCGLFGRDGGQAHEVGERQLLTAEARREPGRLQGGRRRGGVAEHRRERLAEGLAALLEGGIHEGERAQPQRLVTGPVVVPLEPDEHRVD